MCPVTEKDIQEHVRLRLEAERKEKELRKKEKLEAHLFTVVKLVRQSDIHEQIGNGRWFDLAASEKVSTAMPPAPSRLLLPEPLVKLVNLHRSRYAMSEQYLGQFSPLQTWSALRIATSFGLFAMSQV